MASGERELLKVISKLDSIVEVRDARAPLLTSSPLMSRLSKMLPVFLVLSKRDLADEQTTLKWIEHFSLKNVKSWAFDMKNANLDGLRKVISQTAPKHRTEARLAVVGIPNVGKSFFLNALVGKNAASVGGIPGITRGVSWYKGKGFLAVDSPGILDPHGGEANQKKLSWLGCTKSEVIGGFELMGLKLIQFIRENGFWGMIEKKWGVECGTDSDEEALSRIGMRLGCLVSGGDINLELAGRRLVESFSTGKLGRVSIESPINKLHLSLTEHERRDR